MSYFNDAQKLLYPLQSKYLLTPESENETISLLPIKLNFVAENLTATKYLTLNDQNIITFSPGGGGGGGNPFNQNLNTVDSPSFQSLFITASGVDNTENRILVLDDVDNQVKIRDGTTIINQPTQTATFNIVSANNIQAGVLTINNVIRDNTKTNLLTWDVVTKQVEYREISSLPNPFNQNLNTTNDVVFNTVTIDSGLLFTSINNDNTVPNLLTYSIDSGLVEYRTVASLPANNPFDQMLNTTNAPTFSSATLNNLILDNNATRYIRCNSGGDITFKHDFYMAMTIAAPTLSGNLGVGLWSEIRDIWIQELVPILNNSGGEIITGSIPSGEITSSIPVPARMDFYISFSCTAANQQFQFALGQNPSPVPSDQRSSYITASVADQIYTTSFSEFRILNNVGTNLYYKNNTSITPITIHSVVMCCENV